jgi:hypothetical protein
MRAVRRPRAYIVLADAEDYREGYDPAGTFPRFLCDVPEMDFEFAGAGFKCEWDEGDEPGSVVFFAEECGWPDRVAYLVQKYFQRFHTGECWSLTWSETCSKPRVGEFGGGGMLVTAKRMIFLNAHEFVERQQEQVGVQRDSLEAERKDWAVQRQTESVYAPVVSTLGMTFLALLPLVLCGHLLHGLSRTDEHQIGDLLVQEIVSPEPTLLPPPADSSRVLEYQPQPEPDGDRREPADPSV